MISIDNLIVSQELTGASKELRVRMARSIVSAYLTEEEAIKLINVIIEVFELDLDTYGCNHR